MIQDISRDIFTQKNIQHINIWCESLGFMIVLRVVKSWGFYDLALWLCGGIGSGWCGKEHVRNSCTPSTRKYALTKLTWGWNYYVVVFYQVKVVQCNVMKFTNNLMHLCALGRYQNIVGELCLETTTYFD
jgi:hypothetical protein